MVCNDSAFVDVSTFAVPLLSTKDDAEFHRWAGDIISKQPDLLNAYIDLRECWDYYHRNPDAKQDRKAGAK